MRFVLFTLALFLFLCAVKAQWDDGPGWPGDDPDDPDDSDPDDDPPWRPTTTRRPPTRPTPTPTTTTQDPEDTPEPTPTGVSNFNNATVVQPEDDTHHLTSPRTESLKNNTLLIAWNDPAQKSGLPIYRSSDDGFSWYLQGTVKSEVSGRKLLEPHILYIDGSWNDDKNLVLVAVNAVDSKSTNIELYVSTDKGKNFDFVKRIAEGGPAGSKAVAEPYLLFHDKRVTIFYSDQRDGATVQKISQQSTGDMWGSWGKAADVSVPAASTSSQGSISVAQLPNKQYIFVTESSNNATSKVQFQLTSNPESATAGAMQDVVTTTGTKLQSAPFVTWSSLGGANGTLVLSDSTSSSVFVNEALGQGPWKEVTTVAARAYGREVKADPNDKRALRITGGSEGKTVASDVLTNIIDFEKALASAK